MLAYLPGEDNHRNSLYYSHVVVEQNDILAIFYYLFQIFKYKDV